MQDKRDFGQYIRAKREAAGLSQRELARRLHVVESAVSKWERGLSYPDVSLVPDICRELGISEHEFFTACDDESQRAKERLSRRWARAGQLWRWGATACCVAAAVICFICDLAVCRTLDRFWIVAASLGIFWCLTVLPLWVKGRRVLWAMGGGTACLLVLLLVCWLYAGGRWLLGGLAITAISLALPWGAYLLAWRRPGRLWLWASALASVWVFALLGCVWLFTGGDWLLTLGLPIAGVCLVFYWGGLLIVRLPIRALFRSGLLCAWLALSFPVGNSLPLWCATGAWDGERFWSYFLPHLRRPPDELGNRITFWVLLAAAVILLSLGLVQRYSRED